MSENLGPDKISEAFYLLATLAMKEGVADRPQDEFWERAIGKWHVSMNRYNISRKNAEGIEVPAFSAALKFNGWPAGIIDPVGGIIAAGAVANEDAFIDVLKAEIERVSP